MKIEYTVNFPVKAPEATAEETPVMAMSDLGGFGGVASTYSGDKFIGGFGETKLFSMDYWTLRKRSEQLFTENLYARGLVNRLITNEINTGLTPECMPEEEILGRKPGELENWTELVENRFGLWAKSPTLCDWQQERTFGAIQRLARREALICGDVLVVLRYNEENGLPMVQLISGSKVISPVREPKKGHKINQGVERDARGRIVAYWIQQEDGEVNRLPSRGEVTGKLTAWLVFGSEKRLEDGRGVPLLTAVLQSLKEIDRYRDSAQRKAVVNSILAMFIKKTQDKIGSLPLSGGAVKRGSAQAEIPTANPSTTIADMVPGMVMQQLQQGEEPVGFHSQGTDINFPAFESAVLDAIAWSNEIPPEILKLSFSNNYSASQAAINEFKIYLHRMWDQWGENFCDPVFSEWIICESVLGKIDAPGFLASVSDPKKYDIFAAWTSVAWFGSIKPSTDTLKQARGGELQVKYGWTTNARESRIQSGTKWTKNIAKLKVENQQRVEALLPFLEAAEKYNLSPSDMQALFGVKIEIPEGDDEDRKPKKEDEEN